SHREFVEVGFADEDRARGAQLFEYSRVERRDEVVENLRGAGRAHAARAVDVLDGERDAAKVRRIALDETAVGGVGLRDRLGLSYRDECVPARLDRGDP